MKPADPPRLLVVSDNADDARLVRGLLLDEFDVVETSRADAASAADFEHARPDVLLLAFDSLAKARGYCAGLREARPATRASPHRTVVLCTRDELRDAYALCRAREFDDYVLFWPFNHDAPRLLMAVHQALRVARLVEPPAATVGDFLAPAHAVGELGDALSSLLARTEAGMAQTARRVDELEGEVRAAFRRLDADEHDAAGARPSPAREPARLHGERLATRVQQVASGLEDVRRSLGAGSAALAPRLGASRRLQALARLVRPGIDIVDDDEMTRKLLARFLGEARIDVRCSASAEEALRVFRESRRDLVLMDIDLPDVDGVELARLTRKLPGYASVPIVMVTGHSDKRVVIDSMSAGAAGFLVKPLTREKLYAQVNAVLGWPAARVAAEADDGRRPLEGA